MATNLATKYAKEMASMYTTGSFVAGKCSNEWDFSGVKAVKIYTPVTVELSDYTRSGTSRYGTPTEMQDTVQELSMTQDKSFSLIVDKGNNTEQMMSKNAGKMMRLQTNERVVPYVDRYAISTFINKAGCVAGIAKPTKTTIAELLANGLQKLDDALVPLENRYIFMTSEMYNYLRLSSEFLGIDSLGEKALGKGIVGEFMGAKVVKVPSSYLPEGAYFLIYHKNSVLVPYKIRDAKIHSDPPGISGALLEGRTNFDAFVVGARADGVYAAVETAKVCQTPEITVSGGKATITCKTDGAKILYTTDGTDPRYSENAEVYSSAVTPEAGATVKAVAYADGYFTSAVIGAANA